MDSSPEKAGVGGSIPSLATTTSHTKKMLPRPLTTTKGVEKASLEHTWSTNSEMCPFHPNGIVCSVLSR